MKITLEQVREILRKSLGFDSFVASFITSVEENNKATETAGISNDGRLKVNSEFIKKHITSKEDAFCLIFHEVLHPLFFVGFVFFVFYFFSAFSVSSAVYFYLRSSA